MVTGVVQLSSPKFSILVLISYFDPGVSHSVSRISSPISLLCCFFDLPLVWFWRWDQTMAERDLVTKAGGSFLDDVHHHHTSIQPFFSSFAILGIRPGASCMLAKLSTIALHSQPSTTLFEMWCSV